MIQECHTIVTTAPEPHPSVATLGYPFLCRPRHQDLVSQVLSVLLGDRLSEATVASCLILRAFINKGIVRTVEIALHSSVGNNTSDSHSIQAEELSISDRQYPQVVFCIIKVQIIFVTIFAVVCVIVIVILYYFLAPRLTIVHPITDSEQDPAMSCFVIQHWNNGDSQ